MSRIAPTVGVWIMTRLLVFLHDNSVVPWNADIEAIRAQLIELRARGVEFQIHDLNQMPRAGLEHWRNEAYAASMYHHQQIRQTFGAPSKGELLPEFGKEVPALLVYDKEERVPIAVYPHSKGRGSTQRDFSIEAFLDDLAETLGE
jgi:hypothetical protein